MYNNTITLANGVIVPQLALGTWFIDDDKAAEVIIRNGVRSLWRWFPARSSIFPQT